jgi:hypothetical protein
MSEIRRYKTIAKAVTTLEGVVIAVKDVVVEPCDKGYLVMHTDHLAAINQAKIDAVRGIFDNCELWHDREHVRVDSIERYIEQLKEQGE